METEMASPPIRTPRPVCDLPTILGRRVIVAQDNPDAPGLTEYVYDYRAASEVFTDAGRDYVRIVDEVVWYAWTTDPDPNKTERCPRAKAWPAEFIWTE